MSAMALVSTAAGDPAAAAPGGVTVTPEPSDFAQAWVAPCGEPAEDPALPEAVACPVPGALEPPALHPATALMASTVAVTRRAAEQAVRPLKAVKPVRPVRILMVG
jgi:hypothetical protein